MEFLLPLLIIPAPIMLSFVTVLIITHFSKKNDFMSGGTRFLLMIPLYIVYRILIAVLLSAFN